MLNLRIPFNMYAKGLQLRKDAVGEGAVRFGSMCCLLALVRQPVLLD